MKSVARTFKCALLNKFGSCTEYVKKTFHDSPITKVNIYHNPKSRLQFLQWAACLLLADDELMELIERKAINSLANVGGYKKEIESSLMKKWKFCEKLLTSRRQ